MILFVAVRGEQCEQIGRLTKFLYTKLLGPSHGNFVGCIALKPLFNTLVFTLLYVKIPIQQIIHVLLTVGYKFVNDLENWFSLPWVMMSSDDLSHWAKITDI